MQQNLLQVKKKLNDLEWAGQRATSYKAAASNKENSRLKFLKHSPKIHSRFELWPSNCRIYFNKATKTKRDSQF